MLHIKLPKGKVAAACERAAEQCSNRIKVLNVQYHCDLESWRKDAVKHAWGVHKDGAPERPPLMEVLSQKRDRLHAMADMAKHSTGDVYVSPELWNSIKGMY